MKNKKWDTVVEKINEFRHINRQTAGGGTAEEPVDIPDDVMIECDGLVKIYKTKDIEVLALQGLDLTVKRGELMAIIGNSGSGKSTFLNMIGGLDRPSAGKLYVDGKNLFQMSEEELVEYKRSTVGFVWQNNARNLLPYLTAWENVMTPMLFMKDGKSEAQKKKRAEELLELVEMEIRELLSEYDFPGDDIPVIQGSALKALEDPAGPWGDKIMELMDAVDEYIPDPQRDTDKPFVMPVEDVFSITGRGTVATGRVEAGVLHVSDEVEIVGIKEETRKVVVTGIEMFRKLLDEAQAGDNIGALLRGVQRNEIERGQVLAKPGTLTCHTKFTAQVYVLTKDEGGRHTPFFNNYRPQFYFRTTDVTGVCNLPEGTEMCMPGDNIEMTIELIHPIAMSQGLTFAIREGGRTVGSGRVATIIE